RIRDSIRNTSSTSQDYKSYRCPAVDEYDGSIPDYMQRYVYGMNNFLTGGWSRTAYPIQSRIIRIGWSDEGRPARKPSDIVVIGDSRRSDSAQQHYDLNSGGSKITLRHMKTCNVSLIDGHVESVAIKDLINRFLYKYLYDENGKLLSF
ncbi:MAG: hypothetical protein JXR78_14760, partial [Victivallales bacterium]|nr:hypothetical protein [Victivallales bacterium]